MRFIVEIEFEMTPQSWEALNTFIREVMMAKGKNDDSKAPNTGSNSTQKRDDKMTTTDKSKDPNRPHTDK